MIQVRRREFLIAAGGLLASPLVRAQQQAAMIPKIGILVPATGPYIGTPTVVYAASRQGRQDLGYVEGRNVSIEYRTALRVEPPEANPRGPT